MRSHYAEPVHNEFDDDALDYWLDDPAPTPVDFRPLSVRPDVVQHRFPLVLRTRFVDPQYVVDNDLDEEPARRSPMLELLGNSKAWERGTALKLELTLLWLAGPRLPANPPHSTDLADKELAALIGLPADTGARAVRRALRSLVSAELVEVHLGPGRRTVVLRHEGTGHGDYVPPHRTQDVILLGPDLWTRGWIADLSGTALAVLLVLRHATRPNTQWLAATIAESRYGIGRETWARGLDELGALGLMHRNFQERWCLSVADHKWLNRKNRRSEQFPEPAPSDIEIARLRRELWNANQRVHKLEQELHTARQELRSAQQKSDSGRNPIYGDQEPF
jgi:hypothetical protein